MINPIVEAALKVVGGMSRHGYVHSLENTEHFEKAKDELRQLCEEWEEFRANLLELNKGKK